MVDVKKPPAGPLAQAVKAGARIGAPTDKPAISQAAKPMTEPPAGTAETEKLKAKAIEMLSAEIKDNKLRPENRAISLGQLMQLADPATIKELGIFCFGKLNTDQILCRGKFVPVFIEGLKKLGDRPAADLLAELLDATKIDTRDVSMCLFRYLEGAQFPSWSLAHLERLKSTKDPFIDQKLREPVTEAIQMICQREFGLKE